MQGVLKRERKAKREGYRRSGKSNRIQKRKKGSRGEEVSDKKIRTSKSMKSRGYTFVSVILFFCIVEKMENKIN